MAFTKAEFEGALKEALIAVVKGDRSRAKLKHLGVLANEHTYAIWVRDSGNKRIVIRSSVRADGQSAPTGENSIRLWLEYYYAKANDWFALAKLDAWTTREPGWQRRMTNKLQRLWDMALADSNRGRPPITPRGGNPPYQPTEMETAESEAYDDHEATRRLAPSLQPTERLEWSR